jgi:hypothetical protein
MHAALPEIWMKWYKFLLLLPESWRNLIQCDDMILPEVMAQDASNFALISWFLDEYASPLRILCFTRTLCFTWTRATIQRRLQSWFLLTNVSYFYFASPLPSHQPPPPPHSLYAWLNLLNIYFLLYLTLLVSFSKNKWQKLSTLLVLQIRSRDAAAAESWFLFSLLQVFNQIKRNDF